MENVVPIGRFSKTTRLSIKALRHYEKIGLLVPAIVDPSSGYRYYRLGQANRAEAIRTLRSVDMPLDEIREVLAEDSPHLVNKLLDHHRQRLEKRLVDQGHMLRFLERLIEREEGIMPYEVTIKEVPPLKVAALRSRTDLRRVGEDIERGFARLMGYIGSNRLTPSSAPLIVYHDVIDEQTEGDIEICIPVDGDVTGDGVVYGTELAGGSVATTVHRGPYAEIGLAYHTLSGWIQEHGHEMSGPPREVYLNDPRSVTPEEILTEIDWPIA